MTLRPAKVDGKNLSSFDPKLFNSDVVITGVSINASEVKSGDLFIALPGKKTHGMNFIDQAISNGAVAVLSDLKIESKIPVFIDPSPRNLVGSISDWVYNKPFSKLEAVGITGTNGKTTTSNLIKQLWERGETKTRHISFSSMKENTRLSSLFLDIPFMVVDKILD